MSTKGHDSRAIANIFVREAQKAGHRLTIMPLVKYIYFAHGWNLGYINEPLISDPIEAWKFGPVVPLTYRAFRDSSFVIREEAIDPDTGNPYHANLSERSSNIVTTVYKEYSKKSAWGLSSTSHHESAPWYKYRRQTYSHIPNDEIKAYYKGLIEKMKAKSDSENS